MTDSKFSTQLWLYEIVAYFGIGVSILSSLPAQALRWDRGRPARFDQLQAICSRYALIAGGTPAVPQRRA